MREGLERVTRTHPSFPNPTIVQAICDVHFQLAPSASWDPVFATKLFKIIEDDYPALEAIAAVNLQFGISSQGFRQAVGPARSEYLFTHKNGVFTLQLAADHLTFSVSPTYPGWDIVHNEFMNLWQKAQPIITPSKVTRIGLRYVNRIIRTAEDQPPGHWLTVGDYIPAGILRSQPGFFQRAQVQLDNFNRLIITLADVEAEEDAPFGSIIFDIDRIEEQLLPTSAEAVSDRLSDLHEHVWQMFSKSKTTGLLKLLKGKHHDNT